MMMVLIAMEVLIVMMILLMMMTVDYVSNDHSVDDDDC